jgi:tetratricopeptide (TPR) repeat protein
MGWIVGGAVAVLAVVVIVRPELIPGLGNDDDETAEAETKQPEPELLPPTPDTGEAPIPPEPNETAETGETGEPSGEETGELPLDDSLDAILERAEQALLDQHWRDPAGGSLAIELTSLAIADPGHEAIGRLRRDAAKILQPIARKAAKDEDWAAAVNAYRDLLAVWPDHEDGREGFVDALSSLGRKQRSADDYAGLLATADELLNLEPKMFTALKYRADALAGLERWEEAAPAYRAALRIRPSSKDAKKGYSRARKKLKDQQDG